MSHDVAAVKNELLRHADELLEPLLHQASSGPLTTRQAEVGTWKVVVTLGRAILTAVLTLMCMRETERALDERGRTLADVRLRRDTDYHGKFNTTFGRVRFPWFAFRDERGTQAPAKTLFPHYPSIRSSDLLVEWECALAADHPFRKAAEALLFFSHGAADVEDTTLERHAILVGSALPVQWQYLTPQAIGQTLRDRATRDATTGRPIVYASTDAHALRRFVDETWNPKWKMANGIRLWCVDRQSGETVHLGGEYTWGDCCEVRKRFERLQDSGHLPADGDYGDGFRAEIALLTDGSDWIADYVLPLFPGAHLALDPYHVIEQVAEAASKVYPGKKRKRRANAVVKRARKALGMRTRRPRTRYRKGPDRQRYKTRSSGFDGSGQRLLDEVLRPLKEIATRGKKRLNQAIRYVERNLYRMDYGNLRTRGFQIGSGAMESLHRTASQVRLKRAGCNWTKEAAQAILNLRLLALSGRWAEYWAQPRLPHLQAPRWAA